MELKKEVDSALSMYIQTDLKAARNSLSATQARQMRSSTLIQQYKEQIDKTEHDLELEWQHVEHQLLSDNNDCKNDQLMVNLVES